MSRETRSLIAPMSNRTDGQQLFELLREQQLLNSFSSQKTDDEPQGAFEISLAKAVKDNMFDARGGTRVGAVARC